MSIQMEIHTKAAPASAFRSVQTRLLQRKCACGNHTLGGGQCIDCARKKSGLQRKLTIGASNDPLEQEADRIAEQVMASPVPSYVNTIPPRIQRFTGHAVEQADQAPASVDRVLASSGRPLEPALRHEMGQRFGHDFSQVRVHAGTAAEQSAQDVNAQAFTVGSNIVFGQGQFAPETHAGRRLIAHELTHVVQQEAPSRTKSLQPVVKPRYAHGHGEIFSKLNGVLIQRKEEASASDVGTESEMQAGTSPCASDFPCLRTPFPPGQVRFSGCTGEQLSAYAVIPEDGTETVMPTSDTWFDSDGFWHRHHQSQTEWFKIPSHCDVTITCDGNSFSCVKCCNIAASIFKGGPRWSGDHHDARNPFISST